MVRIKEGDNHEAITRPVGPPIWVTEEGKLALEQAIGKARDLLAQKILQMGKAANEDKDIHENPEFRDLRTEVQGSIPRRIADLEATLLRVRSGIGQGNFSHTFVARIEVPGESDEADSKLETIKLVGPVEVVHIGHTGSNGERNVSYASTLGKVLLHADLESGATYEFKTPVGRGKVTIIKVQEKLKE